ncbi:hypothetical protein CC78DRAFT_587362 [Lojkania enalia]|uniref:Uncharacterized protein n=1 Tax=Lojkania enalia TaxID=147567 RepID=A0A9P4MUU9_9PLEO|nr:hypothetical protein CC78DRAFT_587362 [Didymosphaeria enalia]
MGRLETVGSGSEQEVALRGCDGPEQRRRRSRRTRLQRSSWTSRGVQQLAARDGCDKGTLASAHITRLHLRAAETKASQPRYRGLEGKGSVQRRKASAGLRRRGAASPRCSVSFNGLAATLLNRNTHRRKSLGWGQVDDDNDDDKESSLRQGRSVGSHGVTLALDGHLAFDYFGSRTAETASKATVSNEQRAASSGPEPGPGTATYVPYTRKTRRTHTLAVDQATRLYESVSSSAGTLPQTVALLSVTQHPRASELVSGMRPETARSGATLRARAGTTCPAHFGKNGESHGEGQAISRATNGVASRRAQ